MKRISCLVLCFLFTATIAIGWAKEGEPVSILESGNAITTHAANKVLRVRVERHPDNRRLSVACESEDFYTLSEQQLEGEKSKIVTQFEFNLMTGRYQCTARLERNTEGKKKEFAAEIRFIVY